MGKSEILMLLAGVALSIMLAMVAIPMFSSGSEMADRQQVQQELMAIKSSIPLIKGMEGEGAGTITIENIAKHIEGFKKVGTAPNEVLKGKFLDTEASYKIEDNKNRAATATDKITITIKTLATKVDLTKFARLNEICDGHTTPDKATPNAAGTELICVMKR